MRKVSGPVAAIATIFIAVFILALLITNYFSSRGKADGATATTEPQSTAEMPNTAAGSTEADAEVTDAAGKILVAYYSASGHTAQVAKAIADAVGADLFEIVPTVPYTADDLNWTVSGSRVNREHEDESLRDIALTQTEPANFADCDTVFIGYPIWWGIAAWPVNNFVKGNDFSGKTVIPFATSASSGMGQSGSLLADMAGSGDWQSGRRFSGSAADSTVRSWAEELDLAR